MRAWFIKATPVRMSSSFSLRTFSFMRGREKNRMFCFPLALYSHPVVSLYLMSLSPDPTLNLNPLVLF